MAQVFLQKSGWALEHMLLPAVFIQAWRQRRTLEAKAAPVTR